MIRTCGRSGQP